jgi:uncharacterized lipoprotein YmbA
MRISVLSVLSVVMIGCSFLSKTKNAIYTLDRVPGQVTNVLGTPIAINSIELPAGFDRKEIVVRKANNQLDVRGAQQWPATLSDVVLHTLAFDLADRLPPGMMILPGDTPPASVRRIDVVFEDLSAGPDPKIVVDARLGTTPVHIEVPIQSLDSQNVASGMSQALAQLADRIVAGLR